MDFTLTIMAAIALVLAALAAPLASASAAAADVETPMLRRGLKSCDGVPYDCSSYYPFCACVDA